MITRVEMSKMWRPVFEGEEEAAAAKAAAETAAAEAAAATEAAAAEAAKAKDKTFTQDQVNNMMAEDRRKHQSETKKAVEELEALKVKASLTDEERTDLDGRIADLQSKLKTKEELAKEKEDKLRNKHKTELEESNTERDSWKKRFTDMRIVNSITNAAGVKEQKAFDPEQIIAILRPKTQIVEEKDENGKSTGDFNARVKFPSTDKEGKSITLELSPQEAVKKMSETEKYYNLFEASGVGGLGGDTKKHKTGTVDATAAAKDPAQYRKLRKEGKI